MNKNLPEVGLRVDCLWSPSKRRGFEDQLQMSHVNSHRMANDMVTGAPFFAFYTNE